jgi:hypothetical protein
MAIAIIIVGGIPGDPSRITLLEKLRLQEADSPIDWEWVSATAKHGFVPPINAFRLLLNKLRRISDSERSNTIVVKTPLLNGREANQLFREWQPVLAPHHATEDEFLEWLFSREANLVPRIEWFGNLQEAAMIALLSKLVRNKSWNKDHHGHQWTKEEDLLGQSPVDNSDFPQIRNEANRLLTRLQGVVLLTKGGTKGTPKEWCINTVFSPRCQERHSQESFEPLREIQSLSALMEDVTRSNERNVRLDLLINETVRYNCRQTSAQSD